MAKKRKRDHKDNPVGTFNTDHILDNRIYNMELADRLTDEYSVNYILDNIYEQVDDNGWDTRIFQEIMDFCSKPEVDIPK